MSAAAPAARKVTEVAVGVLLRPDDAVLLADRPSGKPYAGYWEFPGGKIEPGETVEHALARELHEELGIDIGPADPWVTFEFDYPHAFVRLHFCRVRRWHGTPHGREGQRLRFFGPREEHPAPLLPAAVPALRWLALPELAAETRLDALPAPALLAAADAAFAQGVRLLLLRAPMDGPAGMTTSLPALAAAFGARAQAHAARLIVDDTLAAAGFDRADGVHLSVAAMGATSARPHSGWLGADIEARHALEQAARTGVDYGVSAAVLPDAAQPSDGPFLGWHGFAALARHAPLPVYARGGLARDDIERAQRAGAHGVMLPLSVWARLQQAPR